MISLHQGPALLLLGWILLTPFLSPVLSAETIHEEKSLYRNIAVLQNGDRRCLVFPTGNKDREQSCIHVREPKKLYFPYVRMTFAGLLLNPSPQKILVIGLGGGSIPSTLSEIYPESVIHAVEIDPAVVKVAKDYFNFSEKENLKVTVMDARVFIKKEGLRRAEYDLIILDAFNGDYIPEHLMTVEFLTEVRKILSEQGALVANTFSTSDLYHHESVTYEKAFGEFYNFRLPVTGNRIILASKKDLPDLITLKSRVSLLDSQLSLYGINVAKYPRYMSLLKDWNEEARLLTDQYSPANLLDRK